MTDMVARHPSPVTQVTRVSAAPPLLALSLSLPRHSLWALRRALVPRTTLVRVCDKQLLADSLPLLPGVDGQLSWSPLQLGVTRVTLRPRGGSWRRDWSVAQREQPTPGPSASTLAAWPAAPRWPPPLLPRRHTSFSTKVGGAWLTRGFGGTPLTDTLATPSTRVGGASSSSLSYVTSRHPFQ